MDGVPSTYCSTCKALRAIKDWHECRDILLIELEPCGHVARRTARLEWLASGRARARRRGHAELLSVSD